ncbi:SOS response-associated peptidase family protein [Microbacterium marmarense]|uniref:SOS response-associated peptidase family protein n=1 Tax=Microbacterium marmarense TaxID=3122051 RepID=A0ABU8LTK2_9MICO
MCASYGLDPRFSDPEELLADNEDLFDQLSAWSLANDGATLLPTGKNLRNLNPILVSQSGERTLEHAWWGYLIDGAPANFPSINTRAERLRERRETLPNRALVPATRWFEMRKPQRTWYEFNSARDLFGMAAVTRPGRTADGTRYTCYSLVMRPASQELSEVHNRVPLLIPGSFADDWLTSDLSAAELTQEAIAQSESALRRVTARSIDKRPQPRSTGNDAQGLKLF